MAKQKSGTPSSPKQKSAANASGAAGRARTRERQQERERRQRRQRRITIVVAVVAVVVLATALIVIANQPAEAPIPEQAAAKYEGIPQSKSEEGYPVLGDPDALVQVKEYSSFDCTHCADFHDGVLPALLDRVRAGDISFEFVPLYGTGSVANGQGAARAAICAGEQGAFWTLHDALFSWQRLYGQQAFTRNRISTGIDNLGIDRSAYNDCTGSDLPGNVLEASFADVKNLGSDFVGTPTVTVNGVAVGLTLDAINAAIDERLAQTSDQPSAEITEVPMPEATTEATVPPEMTPETTQAAGG
jgi:protein-disulfide isomerase